MIIDRYSINKNVPEDAKNITLKISFNNKDTLDYSGHLKIYIKDSNHKLFFQDEKKITLYANRNSLFEYKIIFEKNDIYSIHYVYLDDSTKSFIEKTFNWETKPVNFFYAFSTPHRLTVALPDNSNKTLLNLEKSKLSMLWTYDNLIYEPYDSFRTPKTEWEINIQPFIDDFPIIDSKWERLDGFLPVLKNSYQDANVFVILEVLGADTATIAKINITNKSDKTHKIRLTCVCPGNWKGYNPGWIDSSISSDNLLAGWGAPADKVLIFGICADSVVAGTANSIDMDWNIEPGEIKTGWLIRPYNNFSRDLAHLRSTDWQQKFAESIEIWCNLLRKASKIIIPDEGIINGFYACLADLFIMREPIGGGYIATVPGTEMYRSAPNPIEPALVTIALDQLNFHNEAEDGYRISWDLQTSEGDWSEPGGWSHLMWSAAGFKAWALLEHFYITDDFDFLNKRYPQLLACSRWQNEQRKKTKIFLNGEKSIYYGLMPKGMGDGGLLDGNDFYGIFFTHNIWTIYADFLAFKAALLLDKTDDIRETKEIYENAKSDLLTAMNKGAIQENDGSRWLSSVPCKQTGSCWGILNATFPTRILDPYNELITGTLKHFEKDISTGGIPIHTGWMVEGMWVAITLDNFAEVHLMRDESDIANAFLYATLNHGTPLYTWCEERGQDPNTTEISGDRQHLWTPVAVVRFIRDMLIMEDENTLHLARGIARGWIDSGELIGINNASTRFGNISFNIYLDKKTSQIIGEINFPEVEGNFETIMHCPLPYRKKIIKSSEGSVLNDGSEIKFNKCRGIINFQANLQ